MPFAIVFSNMADLFKSIYSMSFLNPAPFKASLALRTELKTDNIDLSKHKTDRSYTATELAKMREFMQDTPYLLSFDLQHQTGMKIDDATDSKKWSIDRNTNTITIRGSKNGLTYTTRDLDIPISAHTSSAFFLTSSYSNDPQFKSATARRGLRKRCSWKSFS